MSKRKRKHNKTIILEMINELSNIAESGYPIDQQFWEKLNYIDSQISNSNDSLSVKLIHKYFDLLFYIDILMSRTNQKSKCQSKIVTYNKWLYWKMFCI